MNIKNEYELAHVVSTGLMSYANKVQNGATGTFQKFKEGADSITVTLSLSNEGVISMVPYDVKSQKEKIKTLEQTVKTQASEIESLTPVKVEEEPVETPKVRPRRKTV